MIPRPFIALLCLLNLFLGACGERLPMYGSSSPSIETPATLYFFDRQGKRLEVLPGRYGVTREDDGLTLKKLNQSPADSIRLHGKEFTHRLTLDGAVAVLLDQTQDAVSAALLLPGGKGIEVTGSRSSEAAYPPPHKSSVMQLELAANQLYVRRVFDASPQTAPLRWLPSDYVNHVVTPYDFGRSGTWREEQELLIYKGAIVNSQMQQERGLVDVFTAGSRESCSGVLLTRQVVLTAGHCIKDTRRPDLVNVHAAWDRPDKKLNALYADALYQFSDGFDLRGPDLALIHLPYPGIYADGFFVNALEGAPVKKGVKFTAFGVGLSAVYDPSTQTGPNGSEVWRMGDFTVDQIIETLPYGEEKYFFNKNIFQQITMPGDSGGPDFTVRSGQRFILGIHSHASGGTGTTTLPTGGVSVSVPRFRQWIATVPPQSLNSWWVPAMPAYPVFARLSEVKGTRSSITDVNHTTWDEASRAANTMCFNRGFVTGHFDGYQEGWDWGDNSMSFGILCSGPGTEWRDVTSPDIARTGFAFTDVTQVHWAQANRAANGLCAGFAGGRFNGYQKGDLHGVVCYSNNMADRFDAPTQSLERLGHSIGDLNNTPWEVAARAARDYCRTHGPDIYKTYQGGFFNGHQLGNKRGIVCLRTKARCRACVRISDFLRLQP